MFQQCVNATSSPNTSISTGSFEMTVAWRGAFVSKPSSPKLSPRLRKQTVLETVYSLSMRDTITAARHRRHNTHTVTSRAQLTRSGQDDVVAPCGVRLLHDDALLFVLLQPRSLRHRLGHGEWVLRDGWVVPQRHLHLGMHQNIFKGL